MRIHVTDKGGNIKDVMQIDNIFRPHGGIKAAVSDRIEAAMRDDHDVLITKDHDVKIILIQREIPEPAPCVTVNRIACGNCGSKDLRINSETYICNTCGCGGCSF